MAGHQDSETVGSGYRDDFAGPGGWDEGWRLLGCTEEFTGVEWESDACATARAAGHVRVQGDVRLVNVDARRGYAASASCQTFSPAGKKEGVASLPLLLKAVEMVAMGDSPEEAIAVVNAEGAELDERSLLTLHPMVVIRDQRPEWVVMEQVPTVLPIWNVYAQVLRTWGYSAVSGVLNSEAYGVPQTRRRAVLIASRTKTVRLPPPTHSRYHRTDPTRLDKGVPPWVSMAQALGPGMTQSPFFEVFAQAASPEEQLVEDEDNLFDLISAPATLAVGVSSPGASSVVLRSPQTIAGGPRAERDITAPALTVTGNWAGRARWVHTDAEASQDESGDVLTKDGPGLDLPHQLAAEDIDALEDEAAQNEADLRALGEVDAEQREGLWDPVMAVEGDTSWVFRRPSPTIVGSFAAEVVAAPGYRKPGDPPRQKTPGSVLVTVAEAGVLQSFRHDYPWQGSVSSQQLQCGNAIPPLLAAAILRQVL